MLNQIFHSTYVLSSAWVSHAQRDNFNYQMQSQNPDANLVIKNKYAFFWIFLSTPCDSRSWKAHWAVFDDFFFVVYTRAGVEPGLLG